MNSNFEPIVAETYVNQCVEWRQALVNNKESTADSEAKLASLEAVITAFGFRTPSGAVPAKPRAPKPIAASRSTPTPRTAEGVALGD